MQNEINNKPAVVAFTSWMIIVLVGLGVGAIGFLELFGILSVIPPGLQFNHYAWIIVLIGFLVTCTPYLILNRKKTNNKQKGDVNSQAESEPGDGFVIKKSVSLFVMLTSVPVSVLVWKIVFNFYRDDLGYLKLIVNRFFLVALILMFVSRVCFELADKKKLHFDYLNYWEAIGFAAIYGGLVAGGGKLVSIFIS